VEVEPALRATVVLAVLAAFTAQVVAVAVQATALAALLVA